MIASGMIVAVLLLFVPLSLVFAYWIPVGAVWTFATGAGAIIVLGDWIRRGTDQLAFRAGPALGGLLNVTFGSVAELTLALLVLVGGHTAVVKAEITGSLISTSLLGLGLAIMVGSVGRSKLTFNRRRASQQGSLLILCVIALLLPALFDYAERGQFAANTASPGVLAENLSVSVSVVLILVYAANLVYTLITHRDVFASGHHEEQTPAWSLLTAVAVLVGATALVAVEASLISRTLEQTATRLGLTPFFMGIVVLATIGNAPDIIAAMYFAKRGRMGLVMTLCLGSTIQVALVIAPVLVLISALMGKPMTLVFANPLELVAIVGAVFAVNAIAGDGESTWFGGVLLAAVYALFGLAFFFSTP